MSILGNDLLLGSGDEGYNLTRSLRFRSSASAYLNRTPASTGNRQTFTISVWVKRGTLGSAGNQYLFGTYLTSLVDEFNFNFSSGDSLWVGDYQSADNISLKTTQLFRDPSAWYHLVLAIDTTQATASNRVKIYVNGSQVTAFSTAVYPAQNYNTTVWNTSSPAGIGARGRVYTNNFDGYLAEYNFIDGQALTPSSFGETDTITGVWKPKRYAGTYGTNGFYLPFTDNSALTTSSNVGLGKDFSGNGNYWTTNNISITAGVTYDSMTDVPTLTSATAANFCIANPLDKQTDISVTQGNLQISTTAGAGNKQIRGSIALPSSGKFYWETKNTGSTNNFNMGLTTLTASLSTEGAGDMFYNEGGTIGNNGTNTSGYATLALNDTVGVAVDIDANKIYWYKNNTLVNSGGTTINITAPFAPMFGLYDNGNAQSITFGQRPFAYTPPTGYVALNTYNLPTSTIVKGNTVMDATLYTGNGSTQTITNAAGFKPDLVWVKGRNATVQHVLLDSVRGVSRQLSSNTTGAEVLYTGFEVTAFNSNGFTVVDNSAGDYCVNGASGGTYSGTPPNYVGWQWQAGQGTTSSNTNGTITSTVSVNASAGFSVVTYTGTGATGTVGHGLGVAPSLIIAKCRSLGGTDWPVWINGFTTSQLLQLDTTSATITLANYWGTSVPSSTVFGVANASYDNNRTGQTMVAYCWTPIAGYSAFGSLTGNGSADGVFVYLGFKPRFILYKRSDSTGDWRIWDTARTPYNAMSSILYPNDSGAEYTASTQDFDALSNGFKIRNSSAAMNASGGTYIYAAFASNPFRNSLAQ